MPGAENYRGWINPRGLVPTRILEKETDLLILASRDLLAPALSLVKLARRELQNYIQAFPEFARTFAPLAYDQKAPEIAGLMLEATEKAGVGPMAAVAGAISEFVGKRLEGLSDEIIVENGGDIYIHITSRRTIAVYAGKSPLSGHIGLTISQGTWGVCTSSGTFGHSISYGKADASVCLSRSAALSDAAATAIGNAVFCPDDIESGLKVASSIDGVIGALVIAGKKMGAWGNIELCDIENRSSGSL
jgi:ApbE superfamily uncharacterized protein (UPF0280 family)